MEGSDNDRFGSSVHIADGEILVGAPGADYNGSSGAAWHLTGSGATWDGYRMVGVGSSQFDGVGQKVVLIGDVAFLAAPGADDVENDAGTVHIMAR